jgi:exo-beta-1,3-glucanase (GH17 family)
MADYTITLTDGQVKAADYVMTDIEFWVQNCINVRVAKAQKQIVDLLVDHCNTNDITIATGIDAQVQQAYDLELIQTLVDASSED